MSSVYIADQGARLELIDGHVVVMKGQKRLKQLVLFNTDFILLFGHIQIKPDALAVICEEGIEVAFLSMNGRLKGRLDPFKSKNVLLRVAQYERYLDKKYTLAMARTFVQAKLENQREMLLYYQRRTREPDFTAQVEIVENLLKKLDQQDSVASLMGSEGMATAAYFRAFGQMFTRELRFEVRTRRPPKDPVNAVLSLGYSMLTNEMHSLLTGNGFVVGIGFLHEIEYNRPSLALDMVEEFRHPLVDRLVLHLFNHRVFTAADFRPVEGKGIYLTPEALKRFFQQYGARLEEKQRLEDGTYLSFRELFRRQIDRLSKKVQFDYPYLPFKIRP